MSNMSCGHESPANCIQMVPIFSNVTEEEMREIAAITRARTYQKGEMIYLAGDRDERLYVIHVGKVKITRVSPAGKEQVIRVLGPGEFIGEFSLFSPLARTDNAEALERTTMCIIEGERLKQLLAGNPSIALKVMEALSRRLETAEKLIEEINLHTVEERLAQRLLTLAAGRRRFSLEMSKRDLASQLGMSQETLSRKLAAFQDEGLIQLQGHRGIVIKDRSGLETLAPTE